MDKVMKTEIRKIFSELSFQCHTCGSAKYDCPTTEEEKCDKFLFATSSLTSLIIKWLEKADICDECKNKLLTNLTDRI